MQHRPAYENPYDGLKAAQYRMARARQIKRAMPAIPAAHPTWYPTVRTRNLELCDLFRAAMKQKGA